MLIFQNEVEVRKLDIYDEHHVNGSFCATECQMNNGPAEGLYFVTEKLQQIFEQWPGVNEYAWNSNYEILII